MERLIYRGKTFGKELSMQKIPDGIQKETNQGIDNIKDKLYLKINIYS